MNTLGRIFFLLLSIITGLWLATASLVVFASLQHPDAVAGAMGSATVPLLLFIVCAWCFRRLGRAKSRGQETNSNIPVIMTNDNLTAPSGSPQIFEVNPSLRRSQLVMHNVRTLMILVGCYVGMRFLMGRPLLPLPIPRIYWLGGLYAWFFAFSFVPLKWGTVIRMTETGMTLIKNGQSKQTIDWTGIQTLKINKRLISFVLKPGNTPRGVVIGKYGFSVDAWETLQDRIKFHFNANKRM